MRKGSCFWGGLLVLLGVLFLLDNLDIFDVDVWNLFWPLLLIVWGVSLLLRVAGSGGKESGVEHLSVPLEDASKAHLHLKHGAGRLRVGSGAGTGELLTGRFNRGVDCNVQRNGSTLNVTVNQKADAWSPFNWGGANGFDWRVDVTPKVPLSLDVETGANESHLDLSELLVTELRLRTGASATNVTLPAGAGFTRVDVRSGVASVDLAVPEGVAARIHASGGLASIDVDGKRFPRSGKTYQSPGYDEAENQVDVHVETGVGSVTIR